MHSTLYYTNAPCAIPTRVDTHLAKVKGLKSNLRTIRLSQGCLSPQITRSCSNHQEGGVCWQIPTPCKLSGFPPPPPPPHTHLHEHQVPNPDSNLDHNPHARGARDFESSLPPCKRNQSGSGSGSECPCKRAGL